MSASRLKEYGCSTPFGINELFTFRMGQDKGLVQHMCSTPFGINELFTREILIPQISLPVCSTPFGINELFTWRDFAAFITAECSTPFGINELFTTPL